MKKTKKTKKSKIEASNLVEVIKFNGLGSTLVAGGINAKNIANKKLAKLWKATAKNVKKIKKLLKKLGK